MELRKKIGYLSVTPLGDLYKCHYSDHIALEKYMTFVPSPLPQCSTPVAMYENEFTKSARKASIKAFHEMDANCNTCLNFDRLQSDNQKGGNSASNFVYGNCKNNGQIEKIPYKRDGFQVMVHVADYIGMPCWQTRG